MRDPISFEGLSGLFFYKRIAFRAPNKGEWFLSGAIPSAFLAYNDMESRYAIVRPTHHAKRNPVRYIKGEPV